jgi:dynein assembly factor with WDR repeat domains 1
LCCGCGDCLEVLEGHQDEVFTCAFNYAGERILTAGKDNTIRQWKAGEVTHRDDDSLAFA